jgi:molecular chaperone DnaK
MASDILVGIDFGTTNTIISHFINNKSIPILDGVFKTIPSKIAKYNNKLYCGNYIPITCQNIIHSFKISIGEQQTFNFNDDLNYTHSELLIIFFKHLKDLIIKNLKLKDEIIKSVITVPSNFNDSQREIIKSSFELVGLKVIRIINEPSAAALAYGLNHSTNSNDKILVIDTGGGTMDFTILEKTDMFFEILHSEGLNDLGGNNFTNLISDDILRSTSLTTNKDINKNILWNISQKIKEKLTYLDIYETSINNLLPDKIYKYAISRTRFENLCDKLMYKVIDILKNIIINYSDISYVILVGGTSRIPGLQKTISEITKMNPWIHPNLESVVAEGAGLYAGIIENKYSLNEDVLLLDVLPLSLGVELVDGTYSIIIPKNTPLPVKRTQKYTTDSPADSSIKIKVYQGERKIANKNILIGEFIFDKVSTGGAPILEISFKVDLNSIITITIVDKKSSIEKDIIIKNIPQISSEEIQNIIDQSNNLSDIDEKELINSQNIYLIKIHIENSLINLQVNDLISEDDKQIMLDKFKNIEEHLESMNSLQLVETLSQLQNDYSILGTAHSEQLDQSDDKLNDIEKIFLNENKQELINKINILLVKQPDWEEFLKPVLEELSYNTVTIDYINNKTKIINDLENDQCDRDYKQEVNNLCLYLKTELESGSINLGDIKNNLLIELINKSLLLFTENDETIDWEEYLDQLNKQCEEIYSLPT